MTTLDEVLQRAGYTASQIQGLDPRVTSAFNSVLTEASKERQAAQQARDAAELAQRSNVEFYENKIVPSLNQWESEKAAQDARQANITAEAAFYKTQNEEARRLGFIASDAPGYNGSPGYVAGAPGGTPGSPSFNVQEVYSRAGDAIGILSDIQWEHQRLFNAPLPLSPSELVRKADQAHVDPRTYAARTFNWDQRKQEMEKKAQEDHDNKIRSEAIRERDQHWAERTGSNPDIRLGQDTRYDSIQRARRAGEVPDPLALNDEQRRQVTAQMIRKDMMQEQETR